MRYNIGMQCVQSVLRTIRSSITHAVRTPAHCKDHIQQTCIEGFFFLVYMMDDIVNIYDDTSTQVQIVDVVIRALETKHLHDKLYLRGCIVIDEILRRLDISRTLFFELGTQRVSQEKHLPLFERISRSDVQYAMIDMIKSGSHQRTDIQTRQVYDAVFVLQRVLKLSTYTERYNRAHSVDTVQTPQTSASTWPEHVDDILQCALDVATEKVYRNTGLQIHDMVSRLRDLKVAIEASRA